MPILRKSQVQRHIKELEERYTKLREAIEGKEPNPNLYQQFHNNPEQYQNEFVEVDPDDILYALDDFKTVLNNIKGIPKKKADKIQP